MRYVDFNGKEEEEDETHMKRMIILILFGLFMFSFICRQEKYVYYTTYFNGYYAEVAGTEEKKLESVIEINGVPKKIWQEEKNGNVILKYLKYCDGRLFVFKMLPNGNNSFCRVEITNSDYQFGSKKIGVGTERRIIKQVYKNSYSSLTQDTLHEEIYHVEDGKSALQFYFNEEGNVEKLVISSPEEYHRDRGWKK